MEDCELKLKFDAIQSLFDRCIGHAYLILTDSIAAKSAYLDREQTEELERQEYIRIADELAQLYLRYSVLSDIRNCYSDPVFFWEGGGFEAMNPGEKKKYLTFAVASFDYSLYEQDNTAYDEKLPYFSAVVKAVVWERYLAYLQNRKTVEPQNSRVEPAEVLPKNALPPIAETDNPFDSVLTDEQIDYLAEGINDVKMFNVAVTSDELKAIFAGKPNAILWSNNNRLVALTFIKVRAHGISR